MRDSMPPAQPGVQDGPEAFVAKWRARWPEWSVVEVFVDPAHRPVALAWAALQQELTDAAWGGSDPRPGEAKLGWWSEELAGWSQGRRRHPLGTVLQRHRAPWSGLAAALPVLAASRERPLDAAEAFGRVEPVAVAAMRIERVLLHPGAASPAAGAPAVGSTLAGHAPAGDGLGGDPRVDAGSEPAVELMVASWLLARLEREDAQAPPLSILARTGEGDALRLWREELLQRWPDPRPASRPRRLWAALAHARARRGDPSRPLPAWSALWTGWRAARD